MYVTAHTSLLHTLAMNDGLIFTVQRSIPTAKSIRSPSHIQTLLHVHIVQISKETVKIYMVNEWAKYGIIMLMFTRCSVYLANFCCTEPLLVLKAGATKWLSLLYYIGVSKQALGWVPLGLGLGWSLKIHLLNFHVPSKTQL